MIRLFNRHHWHTLLDRYQHYFLWGSIALFCIIVSGVLIAKYHAFGYNGIDLGIYAQVFYNSAQGNFFEFSIHPHLYLGDHFEIFIMALLPFYLLWQSPEMLLILQTVFLALAAWPLWLIARRWLAPQWSLLIVGAYLLNPILLNMAFFEFHLLVFAIPLLLFVIYFYLEKKFVPFIIFILLSLTVREDVSLVAIGFSIMALFDKRSWQWIAAPLLLGIAWFLTALNLTGYYNESSSYKFIALYSWLGATQREILVNAITQPWRWLIQLFSFNNLMLAIGIGVPLAGLYLLRLRYLLPVVLIILQLFLTKISATVLLQTHYTALLIPFIFVAAIAGLHELTRHKLKRTLIETTILKNKIPALLILIVAIIYSFFTFGPATTVFATTSSPSNGEQAAVESMVASIDTERRVVSSFSTLPTLAQRENLYSLHYAFLGVRQFSDVSYTVPQPVDDLVVDYSDFIIYLIQSQSIASYVEHYATGAQRITDLINDNQLTIVSIYDSIVHYRRNNPNAVSLIEKNELPGPDARRVNTDLDSALTLTAWEINTLPIEVRSSSLETLPLSLYWTVQKDIDQDYQLELLIKDVDGNTVHQRLYPLGYGTYPTSYWQPGESIKTNYWFVIPPQYNNQAYTITLQVVSLEGYMTLDTQRSVAMYISNRQPIGPAIPIANESLDTILPGD